MLAQGDIVFAGNVTRLQQLRGLADYLLGGIFGEIAELLVDVLDVALCVGHDDGGRRLVDGTLEFFGLVLRDPAFAQFVGQHADCLAQFRLKQVEQPVQQQRDKCQACKKTEAGRDQRLAFFDGASNVLGRCLVLVPPVDLKSFKRCNRASIIHSHQIVGPCGRPVFPGGLLGDR